MSMETLEMSALSIAHAVSTGRMSVADARKELEILQYAKKSKAPEGPSLFDDIEPEKPTAPKAEAPKLDVPRPTPNPKPTAAPAAPHAIAAPHTPHVAKIHPIATHSGTFDQTKHPRETTAKDEHHKPGTFAPKPHPETTAQEPAQKNPPGTLLSTGHYRDLHGEKVAKIGRATLTPESAKQLGAQEEHVGKDVRFHGVIRNGVPYWTAHAGHSMWGPSKSDAIRKAAASPEGLDFMPSEAEAAPVTDKAKAAKDIASDVREGLLKPEAAKAKLGELEKVPAVAPKAEVEPAKTPTEIISSPASDKKGIHGKDRESDIGEDAHRILTRDIDAVRNRANWKDLRPEYELRAINVLKGELSPHFRGIANNEIKAHGMLAKAETFDEVQAAVDRLRRTSVEITPTKGGAVAKDTGTKVSPIKANAGIRIGGSYAVPGIGKADFSGTITGVHTDTAGGNFGTATVKLDKPIFTKEGNERTNILLPTDAKGHIVQDNYVQINSERPEPPEEKPSAQSQAQIDKLRKAGMNIVEPRKPEPIGEYEPPTGESESAKEDRIHKERLESDPAYKAANFDLQQKDAALKQAQQWLDKATNDFRAKKITEQQFLETRAKHGLLMGMYDAALNKVQAMVRGEEPPTAADIDKSAMDIAAKVRTGEIKPEEAKAAIANIEKPVIEYPPAVQKLLSNITGPSKEYADTYTDWALSGRKGTSPAIGPDMTETLAKIVRGNIDRAIEKPPAVDIADRTRRDLLTPAEARRELAELEKPKFPEDAPKALKIAEDVRQGIVEPDDARREIANEANVDLKDDALAVAHAVHTGELTPHEATFALDNIENAKKHQEVVESPPTPERPTDLAAGNYRYKSTEFAFGGAKKKFQDNISALKTWRTIQAEGRETATPEEQEVLSRFTGWGQFPAVFNDYYEDRTPYGVKEDLKGKLGQEEYDALFSQDKWKNERAQLKALINDEEWDAAKKSTLNSHYTAPGVVDAHWQMAKKLGFKGGKFLETSAGIGYYLGLMPADIAGKTRTSAVELDPSVGGMLKMLYPAANVKVQGFQEHKAPPNFYDLIASNVPFGAYGVHDPDYNRHKAHIHDYFFLKSADLLRPGGLMMHITSTGTMDKPDPRIRAEIAKTCDLVAAIRFPGGAHKKNAGTEVVTDLLILRKRQEGEEPSKTDWMNTTHVDDPAGGDPIQVNRYFKDHPEQILGRLDRTGTMYRGESVNVTDMGDYKERLQQAIDRLPAGIYHAAKAPKERFEPQVQPAPDHVKDGAFTVQNGKLFIREGGGIVEQDVKPEIVAKIQDHLSVLHAARAVLNDQLSQRDDTGSQAHLNDVYDTFVREHGPLNDPANKRLMKTDPDGPFLLSLENYNSKTRQATKADIFSKDTVRVAPRVTKAGSVPEALAVAIHESAAVDVDRIMELTGHPKERVEKDLRESGLAFKDPSTGWMQSDLYLSGNVRKKLLLARAAAEADPQFLHNAEALEKVQPVDVHHKDIDVKMGAPWIAPADFAAFAADLTKGRTDHFDVKYNPAGSDWYFQLSRKGNRYSNSEQHKLWATSRKAFEDIFQAALNNTSLTVYDKDNEGNRVVNQEATRDAEAKAEEMKEAFKEWIWSDDDRTQRLHRYYNDNFNNIRTIEYNGQHQVFPGMNPAVKLHPHIKDFVWQVVTTGKALAAHEVGAGKTWAMVASAMELRRLGLARKPAIACLKANIDQITREALSLYPGAKILSTNEMFDADSRKKTAARMATGDYDLVIMTHDHLGLLQMKPETVRAFINEEIQEVEAARIEAAAEDPSKGNRVVKELEKAKAKLEAKLGESLDASKKDDTIYFEESGIDHLMIDEAHHFKNLKVWTKSQRVKGIPTTGSDRAANMLMVTRWLMEQNNNRGVVFATGTPVSNSMAELYNMQRYLQPQELKERGVHSFDAWANTFGDLQTKMEFTVAGEYKPVTRFAKFVNIPELMQMARQVIDVRRIDDLKDLQGRQIVSRPHRHDKVEAAPKSEAMTALMTSLKRRAEAIKNRVGPPQLGDDNMLVICTDGRKGALDMRLLNANAPDDPHSKTNIAIANVLRINKEKPGLTQIIFSDVGVNPSKQGFSLYKEVINKLVAGGIPRDAIADFSKLEGAKKDIAMGAMRRGEIAVAIGSTEKLGTGCNVQDKLVALHHLDVPWLPASVEQRDGRAWRKGNENKDIDIYRYVSEGSLDQTFWQIIGNKTRFIQQVMSRQGTTERVAKDEDSEELTPEQLMAAASGNPKILEKIDIDEEVKNLKLAKDRHEREQYTLRSNLKTSESKLTNLSQRAKNIDSDIKHVEKFPDFTLKIGDTEYNIRKDAGAALDEAAKASDDKIDNDRSISEYAKRMKLTKIGSIYGMPIERSYKRGFMLHAPSGQSYVTGDSLASIEYQARNFRKHLDDTRREAQTLNEGIGLIKAKIGQVFGKDDELKAKRQRQAELEAQIKKEHEGGNNENSEGSGERSDQSGLHEGQRLGEDVDEASPGKFSRESHGVDQYGGISGLRDLPGSGRDGAERSNGIAGDFYRRRAGVRDGEAVANSARGRGSLSGFGGIGDSESNVMALAEAVRYGRISAVEAKSQLDRLSQKPGDMDAVTIARLVREKRITVAEGRAALDRLAR
jgi:N12 class adenine-specific DNA methylase